MGSNIRGSKEMNVLKIGKLFKQVYKGRSKSFHWPTAQADPMFDFVKKVLKRNPNLKR